MAEDKLQTLKFTCRCGHRVEIEANDVVDENNPEISLLANGWYVLYTEWAESGCLTFCSLDCLSSWVEKAKLREAKTHLE